jgi:serine/threonine protein kinase
MFHPDVFDYSILIIVYNSQHNVIMDDTSIAHLCNFGHSKIISHKGYTTAFSGTARYMAPELMGVEPFMGDTQTSVGQIDPLLHL